MPDEPMTADRAPLEAAAIAFAREFWGEHVPINWAKLDGPMRAAVIAYLRAVQNQPLNATEDMAMSEYVGRSMRQTWAGNLAAEVERELGGGR